MLMPSVLFILLQTLYKVECFITFYEQNFIIVVTPDITRACMLLQGLGSSVSIAIDYGLDGPGSNPAGDKIFCPSRLALGPSQHPVQWVPGRSRG